MKGGATYRKKWKQTVRSGRRRKKRIRRDRP